MSDTPIDINLLYQNHARELGVFARQRVGQEAARDVVQDTFLRVLQYPSSTPISNPRAYLYRVTANVSNDHNAARQEVSCGEVEQADCGNPVAGPETIVEARDLLQQCLSALDELPPVYRHVFLLHRLDGMSQRAIAETLAIPQRTVERYIAKAFAHCLEKISA